MKVLLVENARYRGRRRCIGNIFMENIAIGYLAAVAKRDGHEVRMLWGTEGDSSLEEKIVSEEPDVVGFSTLTPTFHDTIALAARVKKRTGATNIFGGYHVSSVREPCVAEEIREPIDYVVIGEGEETFGELLSRLESGSPVKDVRGIAYRERGQLIVTEPRPRIQDLDKLPRPLRSEDAFHRARLHGYAGELAPSEQRSVAAVTYSRGCQYGCEYCPSQTVFGKGVQFRSPGDVVDEMEYLSEEFGTNMVFLTDLTFNSRRERALELTSALEARNLNVHWGTFYRPNPDRELLSAMKRANCMFILLGIESASDTTLGSLRRPLSGEVLETISIADSEGLGVKGSIIIGLDDTESYADIGDFVKDYTGLLRKCASAGIDGVRLGFMTPFPGVPCFSRYKSQGRLLTEDLSLFDNDHVVVRSRFPPHMLEQARRDIYEGYISSPEYRAHIADKTRRHPSFKKSCEELDH
jgi:radical SAM superfamily enzyme YgiQ (UPF0313 family)